MMGLREVTVVTLPLRDGASGVADLGADAFKGEETAIFSMGSWRGVTPVTRSTLRRQLARVCSGGGNGRL